VKLDHEIWNEELARGPQPKWREVLPGLLMLGALLAAAFLLLTLFG
jgi:hypothetical protein